MTSVKNSYHLVVASIVCFLAAGQLYASDLNAVWSSASDTPATATNYTAAGKTVTFALNYAPITSTTLTVIDNTGLDFIDGFFDNLVQGQLVSLSFGGKAYSFMANYFGGTGNDLTLEWAGSRAYAWGSNSGGSLGNNDPAETDSSQPVSVANNDALFADKSITMVAAGGNHSIGLCSDGTLVAWGDNTFGQLGDGTNTKSGVPVPVQREGTALEGRTVVAVSAGAIHSLALCSDGTVAAWGFNGDGELGDSTSNDRNVPVVVASTQTALQGKTVVAVSAGGAHSLALCSDGTVVAWGSNGMGQLGDGTLNSSNVPLTVMASAVAIAAGGNHSLALRSDGGIEAWGDDTFGQRGDFDATSTPKLYHTSVFTTRKTLPGVPRPVTVTSVLYGKTIVAVAAGGNHSLALCADGTLATWGNNAEGELGRGSVGGDGIAPALVNTDSGTSVLFEKKVKAITAGYSHSLALCSDGTVAAWGENTNGQLGDNTTTNRSAPTAVNTTTLGTGERFSRLSAGSSSALHSLALVASPSPSEGATFTVTNTNDSGPGSLRQAILDANQASDRDTITFAITPLNGTLKTIRPLTPLPVIASPMTIDGYTQSGAIGNTSLLVRGNNAVLRVEIDGSLAGNANGLEIANPVPGYGVTIRGLVLNRFQGDGILLKSGSNLIEGNYLNSNAAGLLGSVNPAGAQNGINIERSSGNTVQGNLISAQGPAGVEINGENGIATNNLVQNNLLGTDVTGSRAITTDAGANGNLRIHRAGGNIVSSNVISGNNARGIGIVFPNANQNRILGNWIGTAADGLHSLGNQGDGIEIAFGASGNSCYGNVIASNTGYGIEIRAGNNPAPNDNLITGNAIGTDPRGVLQIGNSLGGIKLGDDANNTPIFHNQVGGLNAGEPNIIAYNGGSGIIVFPTASGCSILGNSIYSNSGLGIDLLNDESLAGATPNDEADADAGANGLQNKPVLASAALSNSSVVVEGALSSMANSSYRVEFFTNTEIDSNGLAQGRFYLGSSDIVTNGTGTASFSVTLPWNSGRFVTATATNLASGDSSEFSMPAPGLPEISVFEGQGSNGTQRQDNLGAFSFGDTTLGAVSAVQIFTIKNTGFGDLTGLNVTATLGGNPGDFAIGMLGSSSLAPDATTTFSLNFSPSALGTRSLTLQIASNDADENPFRIQVVGVGSLASTNAATLVTSGWATFNGTVNPNGKASTALFQYGTTTGYGSSTLSSNAGSGSSPVQVSFNAFALTPGTSYHYRTVMTNAEGTFYGADQTFTTPLSSPPAWHYVRLSSMGNAFLGGKHTALPSSAYTNFYYYKGTDSRVWALWYGAGAWNQAPLGAAANVDDWFTENTTYNQLYYKGNDGHIFALWHGAGAWNQLALTTTPNVAGELQTDSGTNFTYYRGTDNNLWVLWYGAGRWNQAPLTSSAKVAGDVVVDAVRHFAYYRGTDSQMWVVWYGAGRWNEAQLSTTANVTGDLLVDPGWGTYYKDGTNTTWAVWFTGTAWAQTSLGVSTGASIGPSSLYGHLGIIYTGADGAAHYLGNNGSAWSISALGPAGLILSATLNYKAKEGFIYGRTSDGNLGVFYYQ